MDTSLSGRKNFFSIFHNFLQDGQNNPKDVFKHEKPLKCTTYLIFFFLNHRSFRWMLCTNCSPSSHSSPQLARRQCSENQKSYTPTFNKNYPNDFHYFSNRTWFGFGYVFSILSQGRKSNWIYGSFLWSSGWIISGHFYSR